MRQRRAKTGGIGAVALAGLLAVAATGCAWVEQVNLTSGEVAGDSNVMSRVAISRNGRYMAFAQGGTPLVVGVPAAGFTHVYVRDLATGVTEIIDVSDAGDAGTGNALAPAISGNGRYVAFESTADDLVPDDDNISVDIFVRDRTAGTTTRASVATDGSEGDDDSEDPSISADGSSVAFTSYAENLVDDDWNVSQDIFVRDLDAATTVRASVMSSGEEGDEGEDCYEPAISADGSTVAFVTYEPFASDDLNEEEDVYVREIASGKTRLVSRRSSGSVPSQGGFGPPDISGDGRYVAFVSSANLDGGVTPVAYEIFVRDRTAGTTVRASVAADGTKSNGHSFNPTISSDGRYVAFRSAGSNLVSGDTNVHYDLFVRDTVANTMTLASRALFLDQIDGDTYSGAISDDGLIVAFTTPSPVENASGDTDDSGFVDAYARYYRAPRVTSVNPDSLPRGESTSVTIRGKGFEPKAVPTMEGGIVVGKVVVVSSTKITARVAVPAGHPRGLATIRVENPGPSWNADNGAMGECTDCIRIT